MDGDSSFIIRYLRCAKRFCCISWVCLAVFMFLETGIGVLQRSLLLPLCEWISNLKLLYFMRVFEILSLECFV